MEQLNIEGKRSGDGFVAHRTTLLEALQRATADRVSLCGISVGRRGLANYFKALAGNNVIKVIPANGKGSDNAQADKGIKVVCGSHIGNLIDGEWINENTPNTLAELRVSKSNGVKPNMGASEMATAMSKVIPFSKKPEKDEKTRPVLQCVMFEAVKGILKLVGSDGIGLAVNTLAFDEQEGKALVPRDDLRPIVAVLRRAKRLNLFFEGKGEDGYCQKLIFETDLVRYALDCATYRFPDYEKLIPDTHVAQAHIDTVETVRAINALKALNAIKEYSVDLVIAEGKVSLSSPDEKDSPVGITELAADTEGQMELRLVGGYLATAMRLCGGMVDISTTAPYQNLAVRSNGYTVLIMPVLTDRAKKAYEQSKKEAEAEKPAEAKSEKPAEKTEQKATKKQPVAAKS